MVSIGSHKTAMVVVFGPRGWKSRRANERTLCHKKSNCPNRGMTKVGNRSGKKGVTNQYEVGGEDSDKWCLQRNTKTHSDAECIMKRKSTEVAQANNKAVADPATIESSTVGSSRYTEHENDHYV